MTPATATLPFELYSASYDLLIRMLKPDLNAVEPSLVL